MDREFEIKYHKLEDEHWWFVARRNFIMSLIAEMGFEKNDKILEVGCSGGPLMSILKADGFNNLHGIDLSQDAIDLCKKRGLDNVAVMDGAKTIYPDGEFDLIIASDILEHIEDDRQALSEWRRLLKTGGRLVVFVPAFDFLWSKHDEANKHFRRYGKSSLINKLKEARFEVDRSSYWNFALFFPVYLLRALQRGILKKSGVQKDQLYRPHRLTNGILIGLLKTENFFLKHFNFPVGVSVFTVSSK